jgi:peptidoglycan/xylan/chitin deacetylase (PgdA/CDA1 family)
MRPLNALECSVVRFGGNLASLAGRGGRGLLVLIYHRVLAMPDPLVQGDVEADRFAAQMDLLATCFNPLSLSEGLDRLQSRSLPPRAVSVTFDDGYADNLEVALPIMRRCDVRGTVFVATGYLDGGLMFNDAVIEAIRQAPVRLDLSDLGFGILELPDMDRRRAASERLIGELKYRVPEERRARAVEILERAGGARPRGLMLTRTQVRELRDAGVDIGAHTETHPILTRTEPAAAREDLARCRQELEAILGEPPRLFAYPNGRPGRDYDARHVAMARDLGFTAAVSTAWGAAYPGCDLFQVPRVAPWDATAGRYAARLVKSYAQRNYALAAGEA